MAWTSPKTWSVGEVVTASMMNTYIRDNQNELIQRGGGVPLTSDWDAGSHKITAEQLESDVATTTAPLIIASTTLVTNLNADQVDSQERVLKINADHTHQSTGAEGGKIDHGAAIDATSLLDDDHTQYLKEADLTTKGDIYAASGASTPIRIGVGSNNQVLTADSAQTAGIKWAAGMGLPLATQPTNSKGNAFAAVQDCVDDLAGAGWVYVPTGTFSEAVSITDDDVILWGAGWSSIIDGGTTGHAVAVTGARCVVKDLQVKTTKAGGNNYDGVNFFSADGLVFNVFANGSDDNSITVGAPRCKVIGCYAYNPDNYGIDLNDTGDNSLAVANVINTTGNDGIYIRVDGEDTIVVANRITGWTGEAIDDNSGTATVDHNDTT